MRSRKALRPRALSLARIALGPHRAGQAGVARHAWRRWRASVGDADNVRIRETQGSAMNIIDLQRRQPGPRSEQLLDRLQAAVTKEQRVVWNETGHARLSVAQELEDARATVAARLAELGDDWPDHIAIL
jgi:hypothetical protein